MPGTMRYAVPRRYSIDGIIPTSIEPSCKQRGALRRHVEAKREEIGPHLEPEHERTRIQIVDGAEANRSVHVTAGARSRFETAVALDRLQRRRPDVPRDLLERAAPRARGSPGSTAATPSTSSAPIVSATCASFGP